MAMQTLVIAHAAFGHNHFFKNNYLFRQWTDATGILDYLDLRARLRRACRRAARRRGGRARARRGACADEPRRPPLCAPAEAQSRGGAASARRIAGASSRRITTTSGAPRSCRAADRADRRAGGRRRSAPTIRRKLGLPEENILYFLEKRAPRLKPWQRELVRIARHISQYFYPQKQTKMMNEGCATFVHYEIVHRLHEKGLISDGALLGDHALAHQRRLPAGITTIRATTASIPTRWALP